MTAALSNRCAYQPVELRCIRENHPDNPDAHIRVSGSYVPDRHTERPDE